MALAEGLNTRAIPRDVWLGCLAPRLPTRALFQLMQCNTHLRALFSTHKRIKKWRKWHSYSQHYIMALVFPAFAGDAEYCSMFLKHYSVKCLENAYWAALLGQHTRVIDVLSTRENMLFSSNTITGILFITLNINLLEQHLMTSYKESPNFSHKDIVAFVKSLKAEVTRKHDELRVHDTQLYAVFELAYTMHHWKMLRVLLAHWTFSDELLERAADYQTWRANEAFGKSLAKRQQIATFIRSFKTSSKRQRIE